MSATHDPSPSPPLSAEQWAGLARLGTLVHESERFLAGEAGASLAAGLRRAGDVNERDAPDETLAELLATLRALREAGVLRWVRENAALVTDTLALLRPFLPEILEALKKISLPRLLEALGALSALVPRAQALGEFLAGPAGEDLVTALCRAGDLWEETRADETLPRALRLLARLEEDGSLERLADLSRWLALLGETLDPGALAGDLVRANRENPLLALPARLGRSAETVARTLEDTPPETRGGLTGLYRLLRDPEVQRGLRVLAVLPARLRDAGILGPEKERGAAG